jgi:hypothetical protein
VSLSVWEPIVPGGCPGVPFALSVGPSQAGFRRPGFQDRVLEERTPRSHGPSDRNAQSLELRRLEDPDPALAPTRGVGPQTAADEV